MQKTETIRRTMALHSVFNHLKPTLIDALINCANQINVDEGQPLLRRGETADAFFLITAGEVLLLSHEEGYHDTPVQLLVANDILGWSWLYPPYEWHFDAYASQMVTALRFDAFAVRGLATNDFELGYWLMHGFGRIMLDRLQKTRTNLLQTLTPD